MKVRAAMKVTMEFPDGTAFVVGPTWRTVPDRWKVSVRRAAMRSVVKIEIEE